MKKIFAIAILIFSGCSTIEIIDGLCYNDKDGTYICPEDKLRIEDECEIWRNVDDPDAYMTCIDPRPDLFDQCMGLETTTAWHWCIDLNRIA